MPQWVIDEALGREVERPGFRAAGVPDPLRVLGPTGSTRGRRWVGVALAAVIGITGVVVGGQLRNVSFGLGGQSSAKPVNGPTPGFEEADAALGVPPLEVAGARQTYRFQRESTAGVPVTWSPCRPVHFVLRETYEPPGGREAVLGAIASVAQATGLAFVDDGKTDERPSANREPYQPDRYGDRWAPVLVAWATPDEVPDFGVDVAGEAAVVSIDTPTGESAFVSGTVFLDPAKYTETRRVAGSAVADSVILHEFGHLVGLAHVNDPTQIMWPRGNSLGLVDFQPGDLAGLAVLGRGPCQPDV